MLTLEARARAFCADKPDVRLVQLGARANAGVYDLRPYGVVAEYLPAEER